MADYGAIRFVPSDGRGWLATWGLCGVRVDSCRVAIPTAATPSAARAAGILGPTANQAPTATQQNAELKFERATISGEPSGISLRLIKDVEVLPGRPVQLFVDYGRIFAADLRRGAKKATVKAAARHRFQVGTKLRVCRSCGVAYPAGQSFSHKAGCTG